VGSRLLLLRAKRSLGIGGDPWGVSPCRCPALAAGTPGDAVRAKSLSLHAAEGASRATSCWYRSPCPRTRGAFSPLPAGEHRSSRGRTLRAWPEASGSTCPRRSLRAPDGDSEVFPASFLLAAVALAFCTAGPKCVFHGVKAQRRTGRGC